MITIRHIDDQLVTILLRGEGTSVTGTLPHHIYRAKLLTPPGENDSSVLRNSEALTMPLSLTVTEQLENKPRCCGRRQSGKLHPQRQDLGMDEHATMGGATFTSVFKRHHSTVISSDTATPYLIKYQGHPLDCEEASALDQNPSSFSSARLASSLGHPRRHPPRLICDNDRLPFSHYCSRSKIEEDSREI